MIQMLCGVLLDYGNEILHLKNLERNITCNMLKNKSSKSQKSTGFQAGGSFQIVLDGIIQHFRMIW